MNHMEFVNHAADIRVAILTAIEDYMVGHGLPFNQTEFVEQKETDLTQLGKEALFYGADMVPDDAVAEV